ncbi:MAG: UDP-4-amino-4,6-dideoxy-N-acetyl-beta-L-altrosamine transaminase [Nitrospirae bacterium]|nr:UDP-4-amino-4,6-dideoxy-N-acetyl-beta-L-altrosamine transaminase [Nitrospirota bacterium]
MKKPYIPYGRQSISEADINAVVEVLRSDWLTQGPAIERFEQAVSRYCGVKYAVAVSSGTAALHIACMVAGLSQDDVLLTSPNTFVASANCAFYCGARPDFVDIDPVYYNIDADKLAVKLSAMAEQGRLPKIVLPVHFAGQSCQMEKIHALSREYNFTVIEDACHALGATYKGFRVGSCRFSDMTVFSFHPVKIITTGEGGIILTNNEEYYERLLRLRTHGITRDERFMEGTSEGPWYYQQTELGFNYRMTDLQAALGLSQLDQMDAFITRRRQLAKQYNEALQNLPLILPQEHSDAKSAFHLYVIRLKSDKVKKTRAEGFRMLKEKGIGVNVHYIPVHTQPYYRKLGFSQGDFKEAERYYSEALTLPLYPAMTDENQDYVVSSLREVLK